MGKKKKNRQTLKKHSSRSNKPSKYKKSKSKYLKRTQVTDRKGQVYTKQPPFYLVPSFWVTILLLTLLVVNKSESFSYKQELILTQERVEKLEETIKANEQATLNKPLTKGKNITMDTFAVSEMLKLKVTGSKEEKEVKDGSYLSYKSESGKYLLIDVEILNEGTKPTSINSSYFRLVSGENEYEPTRLSNISEQYITYQHLNPDISTKGKLVFEVSEQLKVDETTLLFSASEPFSEANVYNIVKK